MNDLVPSPKSFLRAARAAARGLIAGAAVLLAGADAHAVPPPKRDGPRTVVIDMDQLAFSTTSVSAKAGETVRFVLRNSGDIMHDFTIGTVLMQKGRRALISELNGAGQIDDEDVGKTSLDTPNAVLIMPGETKELTWTFTETTDLEFGCNVPGHYEFGMKGAFEITPADPKPAKQPGTKLTAWLSDGPATTYRPKLARHDNRADFPAVNRAVEPDAKLTLAPPPMPKKKPARARTDVVALVTPPTLPRSKPRPTKRKVAVSAPAAHGSKSAARTAKKKRPSRRVARAGKHRFCSRKQVPPGSEKLIVSIFVCSSP